MFFRVRNNITLALSCGVMAISMLLLPLTTYADIKIASATQSKTPAMPATKAVHTPYKKLTIQEQQLVEADLATLPVAKDRSKKNINRIYQLHETPLNGRIPIVVLPGRAEEFQFNAWWKKLSRLVDKTPALKNRYKLFVYIYDSYDTLDHLTVAFQQDMQQVFKHYPAEQPLGVISYSLGGMILRDAVASDWVLNQIDTAIAIGVPFHGTPLFDLGWYSHYAKVYNHSPIRKWWIRALYQAYMGNKDNLISALAWRRFDTSGMPPGNSVIVTNPNSSDNRRLSHSQHELTGEMNALSPEVWSPNQAELKKKMIIYAGYLQNRFTTNNSELWAALKPTSLPKTLLKSPRLMGEIAGLFLPVSGVTLHSIFKGVNYQLSSLPAWSQESGKALKAGLYRYNDGTVPISSALFLPRRNRPYTEDLSSLAQAADSQKVRVFPNIDHMDLGHYRWPETSLVAHDEIHPSEGRMKPNEWIFHDFDTAFGFASE